MKFSKIILVLLLVLGFAYRLYGMSENHSFWTDEDHVAIFSKAVLEKGKPVLASGFDIGIYQLPMYWLGALGMKVFGNIEMAIRWPSLVFGVLTILAVYLLSEKLFSKQVGLLAAFLTTFFNIEILWSIQARPYQAIQFFWLLGTYLFFRYFAERQKKFLLLTIVCGFLAGFFHPLGSVFLASQFIFYAVKTFFRNGRKEYILPLWLLLLANLPLLYFVSPEKINKLFSFSNFFYYRVFLINNYLLLVLFCLLGFCFLLIKNKKREFVYFVLVLGMQVFAVSFLAPQPFTRYFYPIFVFIILLASYGILEIRNWILDIGGRKTGMDIGYQKLDIGGRISSIQYLISIFLIPLVVFSLWKSDKLSLFPQKIYSLNADMQEIPEVDWKKIYMFVGEKLKLQPGAILVTNWMDTPIWFLGEGRLDFLLRKSSLEVDLFSGAKYINSLDKFLDLIEEEPAGILVLDSWDEAVPEGIREYCHNNLKLEFEIDRLYPVQPRYWTVWVYSWGYTETGY